MPKISIIVTSYNLKRLTDIQELVQSIRNQATMNYDVIYVTERDPKLFQRVSEIVEGLGDHTIVTHNTGPWGLAESRNIGASLADGEILAFVDDDVTLDQNWSAAIERGFTSIKNIVGATGPAIPNWKDVHADWLPVELDWLIGCTRWFHSDKPTRIRNCWGMNMCFQRAGFEKAGGFSASTGYHRGAVAEDVDLSLRIKDATGGELYYLPEMKVLNSVYSYRLSRRFVIQRSMWIGHSRRAITSHRGLGKAIGSERSVLFATLKSLVRGNSGTEMSTSDSLKRFKITLLCLISLAIGYLLGNEIFLTRTE